MGQGALKALEGAIELMDAKNPIYKGNKGNNKKKNKFEGPKREPERGKIVSRQLISCYECGKPVRDSKGRYVVMEKGHATIKMKCGRCKERDKKDDQSDS